MKDEVLALAGFLAFRLGGHRELVSVRDVLGIRERGDGGSAVRLSGDRVIMTGIDFAELLEAFEAAREGDTDAA